MSHIITQKEDIKTISEYLELLRIKGYKDEVIYQILNELIPKNKQYQVFGLIEENKYPAVFNSYKRLILVSKDGLEKYTNEFVNQVIKLHPYLENQKDELFRYQILYALFHEVEHVYQYMIAKNYIDFPYQLVVDGYKNIFDTSLKDNMPLIIKRILIERYRNQKDKGTFVLERNANVEAYDLIHKLSKYENNEEIKKFIMLQRYCYLITGYKGKSNGSFEETYKKLWRKSTFESFNHTEEIPEFERIRYALPIKKETKKLILQ